MAGYAGIAAKLRKYETQTGKLHELKNEFQEKDKPRKLVLDSKLREIVDSFELSQFIWVREPVVLLKQKSKPVLSLKEAGLLRYSDGFGRCADYILVSKAHFTSGVNKSHEKTYSEFFKKDDRAFTCINSHAPDVQVGDVLAALYGTVLKGVTGCQIQSNVSREIDRVGKKYKV